ncbi:hydrogenase nickel incorporation protein HypB [Wukongibacter sp. M2B1]|uniref:hydrogenase nickel incorporation protein HypB n=1 Tax=Wukongibacter sp. M2B1 TaxID=3088895 RepID=UPI003D79B6EF
MKQILIQKNILKNNDEIAKANREILKEKEIFTINLLGSPGSGKTSILECIIKYLNSKHRLTVIEGDLYTTRDAERLEKHQVEVVQINTGGACHLDAAMVEKATQNIDIDKLDFLVIENVGNLVCPAAYDLGEDMKITVMSVTEGHDKPLKYPSMFQRSSVVILNKMDIIEYTNFDIDEFYKDVKSLNKDIKVFEVSCITEEGIMELCNYFDSQIASKGGSK